MINFNQNSIILDKFYNINIIDHAVFVSDEDWKFEPHFHDYVEIFVQICGSTELYVEKNIYKLQGNEIRLYAPGEIHSARLINDQNVHWYQISIPTYFFEDEKYYDLGNIIFNREPGTKNVFVCSNRKSIIQYFEEAFTEQKNNNPLFQQLAFCAVLKLLCYINSSTSSIESSSFKNESMKNVIDIINDNFSTLQTLEDISKATNYSTSYITKMFKGEFNITPHKFLLSKKFNEAKKALASGMSVQEACDYAGFPNYANFITLFRKTYGITPKKYKSNSNLYTADDIHIQYINPQKHLNDKFHAKNTNPAGIPTKPKLH